MVVDEAAYVAKGLFFETILPLLEMKVAALICISTPLDELNWFSSLLEAKDEETGDLFFFVVRIGLVCKACLQLPQAEMGKCSHKVDQIPPWKSGPRHKRVQSLYRFDKEDRGLRETAGIIIGAENTVFSITQLRKLFDAETMPIYTPDPNYIPDRILLVADPDAGGPSSLAIMSGFIVHSHPTLPYGTMVVPLPLPIPSHTHTHPSRYKPIEKELFNDNACGIYNHDAMQKGTYMVGCVGEVKGEHRHLKGEMLELFPK